MRFNLKISNTYPFISYFEIDGQWHNNIRILLKNDKKATILEIRGINFLLAKELVNKRWWGHPDLNREDLSSADFKSAVFTKFHHAPKNDMLYPTFYNANRYFYKSISELQ